MAIYTEKPLTNPVWLSPNGSTLYTVPSSTTTILTRLRLANVTSTGSTYSLYVVPSGTTITTPSGTTWDMYAVLGKLLPMDGNTTWNDVPGVTLTAGQSLYGYCPVTSGITCLLCGVEKI